MSVTEELDAAWAEWMKPTNPSGKRSQGETWRRDNPGEWNKLKAYRAGGTRPALATNTGKQMVFHVAGEIAYIKHYEPEGIDRATMTAPGFTILRDDTAAVSDPEPGLWGSIEAVSDSRHTYVTTDGCPYPKADGTSQGNTAYRRMTVVNGDDFFGERAELGRNNWQDGENTGSQTSGAFALAFEGQRKLSFWSMRFPSASFDMSTVAWQQIFQWKQSQPYTANVATRDPAGTGVTMECQLYGDAFRLHTWWTERWTTAAPPPDEWIRFAMDVTFSQWPAIGKIQLYIDNDADGDWLDADEMSPVWEGANMMYATAPQNGLSTGDTIPNMLAAGIYHDPAAYGTTSVELDNVQVLG